MQRIPWLAVAVLAMASVPWMGSRFYTFLATDIVILALFATSLNLVLGYTGLVSFGHAAYFGVGAYTCAILMKTHGAPFIVGLLGAPILAGLVALVFGYFCVRLTRIYFAMLTLAFAQIVWGICFKWNAVTGGEQGMSDVPYPDLSWMAALPLVGDLRVGEQYYLLALAIVAACLALLRTIVDSPFGRMLTVIRENPERARFIGLDVRRYELAAFVLAGAFAGVAGALFGLFNRGVFPDFAYWSKSAEVLIMVILGGMGHFWGPVIGAGALILLNQQISAYTQFWPFVLGVTLIVLLFVFPGGIVGTVASMKLPPKRLRRLPPRGRRERPGEAESAAAAGRGAPVSSRAGGAPGAGDN
ncbi:MAG: branched-chain amino acid ABC transporter permease [Lautropia sp.]|nr:branched-chain amino acid ABC transporter permease [Lautropia sp.]